MPPIKKKSECDLCVIFLGILVFALPLTLLIPDFSLWNAVPKVRVTRFHILTNTASWHQMNGALLVLLTAFFGIFLEIRRRKLEDMVKKVLRVNQATETTMNKEKERHTAAIRDCMELLDASRDHYENLALLRDNLRYRNRSPERTHGALIPNHANQHPPMIEPSLYEI